MHVIGTAGHVDHGKSTLIERLTGIDPDRFEEEKRRGLTIDLGFAWLALPSGREVGIVDVPGHERFVRNMLAGTGGVSLCLFVVAANEGWKPQSAEHLGILDVLDVSHGVIALTKSDAVDADTLAVVERDVRARVAGTRLADAPIVPCSALTGDGLDELSRTLDSLLANVPPPEDRRRPRLWIDRVFTIAGAGTVVTGSLWGGSLSVGQEVIVEPKHVTARVRDIQTHKKRVATVAPGNRVALNLAGIDKGALQRGDAVVLPAQWASTQRIEARVRLLPEAIVARDHHLSQKGAYLLYTGSAETPVHVRLWQKAALGPGESGYALLTLRDSLPLTFGDRFVLRDVGRVMTIGGGVVLDPFPQARRAPTARVDFLRALDGADPARALLELVSAEGLMGAHEAYVRTGVADLPDGVVRIGRHIAATTWMEQRVRALQGLVEQYHTAHPLERGMPREALRREADLDPEVFDGLVQRSERLLSDGTIVRLRDHSIALSPAQESARDALITRLKESGFSPPLARELHVDAALLRALVENGDLVRINDFYLVAETADDARRLVREHIERHGPATVAQIRDVLGTSRKYAVPLCEWLDATGATTRRGDVRVLGPKA